MPKPTQFIPEKTAMLVIDVQRALFSRPNPIYRAEQLINTINSLAERSQIASIPVFYIQHANTSLLIKDTEGWLIHPDISPQESDMIIHKTQGNAFLDTTLHKELDKQGVKDLIITGLVTQGCIRATCLGGLELGYRVFLVEDGHSNFNKDAGSVIRKNQTKLEQAGVDIISTKNLAFA